MDPFSISTGIAGLLSLAIQVSGAIAVYAVAVKESPKHVGELQQELLLLQETLTKLKEFFDSEKVKGRDMDKNLVLDAAITACRTRIEKISNTLRLSDGGKMSRMVDRLLWPFSQKDVMQTVENLRRYTQTFQFSLTVEGCNLLSKTSDEATKSLQVQLDTANKVNELSLLMGGMAVAAEESSKKALQIQQILQLVPLLSETATDVKEISHGIRLAELREQERRATEILDWLAPISVLQKHRDVQAKRTPRTGRWFLEKQELVGWFQLASGDRDVLCVGGPGVGKTVLTSLVVDHLRETYKDSDVAIVYYYCDYGEQQAQTAVNFARALLRQLSSQSNSVPTALSEFYQKTRNDVKDQTWFNELQVVLQRVASTFAQCFIVIDALDETEPTKQRSGLLEVLKTLRLGSSPSPKVFVTTHPPARSIQQRLEMATTVEVSASREDLRTFLSQMINDYPDSDYIMDATLRMEVLDTLCQNAHGIFLLPVLQIKDILDQFTKADVRRALSALSVNLHEAFVSTIERIKLLTGNRRTWAVRSLLFISHAKRALSVDELRHALATRLEDEEFDSDHLLSVNTILDNCFGLVMVDAESSTIRLVHHSLEEFLRSQDHGLFEDGDLEFTRICLRYLTFESLKDLPFKNRADFDRALEELPFLSYAAMEWGYHAQDVPLKGIKDLVLSFLNSTRHLLAAARARAHKSPNIRKWKERMFAWAFSNGAGISMATTFGLMEIVQLLISQTDQPVLTARNVYGSTPLHAASMKGYSSTAELLISHGADILDLNRGKASPLYLAVAYSRLSTAKMLLSYGGEQLNIAGKDGWTPLHKGVDTGDEDMVALLLQAGAGVEIGDEKGMTALHIAARRGDTNIARLLLLAGAKAHATAKDRTTPLDHAATGGHHDSVKLLLDNGGRPDHQGYDLWHPIHRAVRGGHLNTTRLLIERGSNLLVQDYRGSLPIHLAVRSSNIEVVSLLLDCEPNIKREQLLAKDKQGSTARDVAFYTANYEIHKLLRGAEMEVLGSTAIPADRMTQTIEEGDISKVYEMLSEKGMEIDQPNEDGQQPLHVAIQEKRTDIAELLLNHGASIESVGYHGWRPLHIASSIGDLPLLNLCLDRGANVHTVTDSWQTPLHKACSSRSTPVVRRLLEAGANPEAANSRGLRVLHVAAQNNMGDVVRLLVQEFGVDVLAKDRTGDTAAVWAERASHLELVAFLRAEEKKGRKLKGNVRTAVVATPS